MSAFICY